MAHTQGQTEPSLGQLFGDLSRETGALVRHEIALARAEMTQKVSSAIQDFVMLAAGGALAYAGLLAALATLIIGLSLNMGVALTYAALGTTLLVVIIGGLLFMRGLQNLKRLDVIPRRTVQTIKEDVSWARKQLT